MNEKVLLVEDSPVEQLIVNATLEGKCQITVASTLRAAEEQLKSQDFALLILDIHLPDGDGLAFCERLRQSEKYRDVPIIVLTGDEAIERLEFGFSNGVDDYILKPLEPKEFVARVTAKLARHRSRQNSLEFCGVRISFDTQRAYLSDGQGQERLLTLTPIEFKLLSNFIKAREKILSREALIQMVWGTDVHVSTHTLDTHISSLRKKMGTVGKLIKAVVKKGYCFSKDQENVI